MTIPDDNIKQDIITRKKSDLIAICLAFFIELNCASYILRSSSVNLTQNVEDAREAIGFPFLVLAVGGIGGEQTFRWYALVADLFLAILASWLFAKIYARKLPFLLREQTVPFRYSIRSVLVLMACVAMLLGVSRIGPQQQALVREGLCFLGPLVVGIIWSKFRHLCWSWLAVVGTGLFLLAVLVTFPTRLLSFLIMKCVMQTFVPVAGILSGFVLTFTAFRFLRHMEEVGAKRVS